MSHRLLNIAVLCCFGILSGLGFTADDAKDKVARAARERARRVQQQIKTLEAEKGALVADKARLEGELKEALAKADLATRRIGEAERARAELAKALAASKAEASMLVVRSAEEERNRLETQSRLFETERRLAEQRVIFDAEKRRLEGVSAQHLSALAASRERNERMYKLGFELIERYENKSFWTSALQAEPFTGLKRAQIEKMAEEDREKFDKERLPPAN